LALVATAAGLLALSVLGAAFSGPWELETRLNLGFELFPPVDPTPPDQEPGEPVPPSEESYEIDFGWLGGILVFVFMAFMAAGVWWLLNRARFTRSFEIDSEGTPWATDMEELEPEVPVLQSGVDQALRQLSSVSDPTDAVIAAWLALEEAAALSGIPRRPAQTPTEFTVTVLDATPADVAATRGLVGLYHLARFSSHRIGSEDVASAVGFLNRLSESWSEMAGLTGTSLREDDGK
jgi:hypothetical protein